jgi:ADP-ribose pyrophosphatase
MFMAEMGKAGGPASGPAEVTVVAQGRFIRMVKRGTWEFVERNKVANIVGLVAVTPQRRLLLIEHFNPPFAKPSIELPAGLVGDVAGLEGETLPDAATRELLEETGYAADNLVFLAKAATSSGLCTEQVSLFRAVGVKKVAAGGGVDNENITVHEVPLDEAPTWLADHVRRGWVVDMKIYAALFFAGQTEQIPLSRPPGGGI